MSREQLHSPRHRRPKYPCGQVLEQFVPTKPGSHSTKDFFFISNCNTWLVLPTKGNYMHNPNWLNMCLLKNFLIDVTYITWCNMDKSWAFCNFYKILVKPASFIITPKYWQIVQYMYIRHSITFNALYYSSGVDKYM